MIMLGMIYRYVKGVYAAVTYAEWALPASVAYVEWAPHARPHCWVYVGERVRTSRSAVAPTRIIFGGAGVEEEHVVWQGLAFMVRIHGCWSKRCQAIIVE
ncbi:hypothetical protein KDA_41600 [Dictyobacter alpinus]|uniref:Uncharacterized protein n=1 Tax=Dictyobacter alpinus TaxID=2014873 RepID=A0A402BBI2_9CHLR|nr:hypothetical protein KDA_41600 [Dictyobacter alpinus]